MEIGERDSNRVDPSRAREDLLDVVGYCSPIGPAHHVDELHARDELGDAIGDRGKGRGHGVIGGGFPSDWLPLRELLSATPPDLMRHRSRVKK